MCDCFDGDLISAYERVFEKNQSEVGGGSEVTNCTKCFCKNCYIAVRSNRCFVYFWDYLTEMNYTQYFLKSLSEGQR